MKTSQPKAKYNTERNSLSRKAKRNYYESLDLNYACDNKNFWAIVKSLL